MHVVLVVDDEWSNPAVQREIQAIVGTDVRLKFFQWKPLLSAEAQLSSVADLLDTDAEENPTALLLDVMFPTANGPSAPLGLQLAKELSKRFVPVVVMSSNPDALSGGDRLAFLPKTRLAELGSVLDGMLANENSDYHTKLPGSERISRIASAYDKSATIVNGLFPLDEVINPHELRRAFETDQAPRSMWGIAPKAPMHLGHDRFILKQLDLIRCGCRHSVLLADLHMQLSDSEIDPADVSLRTAYYQEALSTVFGLSDAEFVLGSSFQYDREYANRLYRCLAEVRAIRAYRATPTTVTDPSHLVSWQSKGGAAVPKYQEFPSDMGERSVANLVYPVMQALDVYHQDARIVLGDFGQKQIYVNLGRDDKLQKDLKFRNDQSVPVLLFLENSTDILGQPMVQSRQRTRITFHETTETLDHKISRIVAPEYLVEGNPLLDICRYSVFPWIREPLLIRRHRRHSIESRSFDELAHDYRLGHIHPSDLKESIREPLLLRIKEFQNHFAREEKRHLVSWIDVKAHIESCLSATKAK